MPRSAWSLHAYQLIVPDEQLDLFACREARLHLLARQLQLGGHGDRLLCGGLLPAGPLLRSLQRADLRDPQLCPHCARQLQAERRGLCSRWTALPA